MENQSETAPNAPLFSVVIPCYGAERFIKTTLESIYAQTEQDFEIVVVHDESPDGTLALLRAETDPRLRIIDQRNEGECGARNRGIREARGRYVAFLDSDDAWYPQHLELARRFFEQHPDVMWYASQHRRVPDIDLNSLTTEKEESAPPAYQQIRWFLEGDRRTTASTVVAQRCALTGDQFPVGVKMHGDTIGWIRMAQRYPELGCCDEVTMLYRFWGGSASDNYLRAFASHENNALTIIEKLMQGSSCSEEARLFYQEFSMVNWWQRLSGSSQLSWIAEIDNRHATTGALLGCILKIRVYANHLTTRATRWCVRRKLLAVRKRQAQLIKQARQHQIKGASEF